MCRETYPLGVNPLLVVVHDSATKVRGHLRHLEMVEQVSCTFQHCDLLGREVRRSGGEGGEGDQAGKGGEEERREGGEKGWREGGKEKW